MPGVGGHKFYFTEKVPLVFLFVLLLLFANTFFMLSLDFVGKYFVPKNGARFVSWYDHHSILIQIVLTGVLFAILLVYRKRVHYRGRKSL
jgi:hypothetical protein